jgi:hypothetical protein
MGAQGAQALPHLEPLRIQALQHVCQLADLNFEDANISPESRTSTLRGHPQSKHASKCLVSYVSIVDIMDESKRSTLTHHACVLIWGKIDRRRCYFHFRNYLEVQKTSPHRRNYRAPS